MKQFTRLIVIVWVLAAIMIGTPAHAQENAAAQSPAGIGILILLMGLGAVGLVGLTYFSRARPDRDSEMEDEEEE